MLNLTQMAQGGGIFPTCVKFNTSGGMVAFFLTDIIGVVLMVRAGGCSRLKSMLNVC